LKYSQTSFQPSLPEPDFVLDAYPVLKRWVIAVTPLPGLNASDRLNLLGANHLQL